LILFKRFDVDVAVAAAERRAIFLPRDVTKEARIVGGFALWCLVFARAPVEAIATAFDHFATSHALTRTQAETLSELLGVVLDPNVKPKTGEKRLGRLLDATGYMRSEELRADVLLEALVREIDREAS
jgi:hypothetical protein